LSVIRKLARNIATNWMGLALNIVISFFLAPYVVNSLGATYYGIWAVTLQFTGYLYLMDFGVRDAAIRYVAKFYAMGATRRLNEIVRVSLEAYFPIFIGAVVLSITGALAFPHFLTIESVPETEISLVFFLTGLTIAQMFLFNVFSGVLGGIQRFDIGNYIGMSIGLVRAGLVVAVLDAGYGIVGLALAQLGVSLTSSIVNLFAARYALKQEGIELRLVRVSNRRRRVLIRRVLGYSVFVFINNIGQKTNLAAGALIIAFFLPVASVTPYAIAASLAGYVRSLIQASSWVFNPLVSHYAALNDTEGLETAVRRGAKLAVVVGLPVLVAFMLVGDAFIGLWMGPDFVIDTATVLFVLAIMELVSAPHHVMAAALYGISKHKELAVLRVIEALLNVSLSIWLVQIYGVIGVAFGALVPHVILALVGLPLLLRKHVGIPLLRMFSATLARPLAAVVPFAVLTEQVFRMWSPQSLLSFFAVMAALTLVYGLTVLLVALDADERALIFEQARSRLAHLRNRSQSAAG